MILTKDNLLRFVREKKYVTPTNIAESFDTTTIIGSAALSGLSKDNLIKITNLKIGSTPYYYDPKQSESLIELANKHFSSYDKEIFLKLQSSQVLNDISLSIQEGLAIKRIKDFAIPVEINSNGKNLKFWVWYLRDLKETKTQILDAIKPKTKEIQKEKPKTIEKEIIKKQINIQNSKKQEIQNLENKSNLTSGIYKPKVKTIESYENKIESFIKNYFEENYLKIIEREEKKNGISYTSSILINKIEVIFDCFYFEKKPKESDLIKFYISSQNPKIIFIENVAKKYFKLVDSLDNLTLVNI